MLVSKNKNFNKEAITSSLQLNMEKFKIEVSFKQIFDVKAENLIKAKEKAKLLYHEKIGSGDYYIDPQEYKKPINWYNEAEETAENIINENKKDFIDYIKDKWENVPNQETQTQDIYDDLYQDKDLVNMAHEHCDGRFIYNDSESIKEAIDCINDLSDYEETDTGLWEGLKTIEEIINTKAFFTFRNAVICILENQLKELIDNIIAELEKDEQNIKEK